MPKAQITTPSGFNVKMEGTPAEILAVVEELKKEEVKQGGPRKARKLKTSRVLLTDLVGSLIDGGFFKKPRDLASIKAALAETGHHYPVTTLSQTMLREVRRGNLGRFRGQNRWLYTQ